MAKSKPGKHSPGENFIEDILWEISPYLYKNKWWRQWLRYLVFLIGVPIALYLGLVPSSILDIYG